MTDYSLDGKNILNNGKIIASFSHNVAEIIQFEKVIVIRLQIPTIEVYNENVISIFKDGTFAWQVPKRNYLYSNSPYTELHKEGTSVKLLNWDGGKFVIEADTGRIILDYNDSLIDKRPW